MYLSVYLRSIYRSMYLSIYLSLCLSLANSLSLSVCLSIDLSIYLSISLSLAISLSVCLSLSLSLPLCLSVYLAIYLQDQKRRNSARLPSCLNITTSKTKQFCETSSFFELDNIRNEAILQDFLIFRSSRHQKQKNSARLPSKMESWVQSCQPRTNAFCDFSSPLV